MPVQKIRWCDFQALQFTQRQRYFDLITSHIALVQMRFSLDHSDVFYLFRINFSYPDRAGLWTPVIFCESLTEDRTPQVVCSTLVAPGARMRSNLS